MIEAFMFPKLSSAGKNQIAFSGTTALQRMHNARKAGVFAYEYRVPIFIKPFIQITLGQQWIEYHVNMI